MAAGEAGGSLGGMTPRHLSLMVVDDHPAVRLGLVQLLEAQPDFKVEAICINSECALARALTQHIDVAVVDYQLPGHNGLWVCRQLKLAPNPPAVVVFSAFANDHLAACCAVAQADALLNKGVLGSELCYTIRSVGRGGRLLPRVPQPLADMLRRRLDEHDLLLFGMLLAAIPRAEISRALGISDHELRSRTASMLRTLEALPGERAPFARPTSRQEDLGGVLFSGGVADPDKNERARVGMHR